MLHFIQTGPYDIPALLELDAQIFDPSDAFDTDAFAHFTSYFLRDEEGKNIGSCGFALNTGVWTYDDETPPQEQGTMFLVTLGILEGYRRLGYGRQAMEWMIGQARAAHQLKIVSCCQKRNEESISLHERLGFEQCDYIPFFYPEDDEGKRESALVFELIL